MARKLKHSKIKNTGILFELLTRQITADVLAGKSTKSVSILKEYFNEYEVVAVELPIYEEIKGENYNFRGYIDAIVKTADGKHHIFDWKTTSWGWDARRRSEKIVTYQLTLYKYFYAQKTGVPLSNIETHFALLKRTAKKDRVEFFRVTSGPRKIENALKLLKIALYNIRNKRYIKNRASCNTCMFQQTEHCP